MGIKRLEIEAKENGYNVTVWKDRDEEGEQMMYSEPKTYVATDIEEVTKMVKEKLEDMGK